MKIKRPLLPIPFWQKRLFYSVVKFVQKNSLFVIRPEIELEPLLLNVVQLLAGERVSANTREKCLHTGCGLELLFPPDPAGWDCRRIRSMSGSYERLRQRC